MSFLLINKMTTLPTKRQEVVDILLESGSAFEGNASCLMYLVSASKDDENVIWIQDIWTNEADHMTAMGSPEITASIKKAMPLLQGMPEQFAVDPMGGKSPLSL